MGALDIISSFADPFQQDQGASKLVNCRAVMRKQEEQRLARVRLVGSPGLRLICKPNLSACITLGHALGTVWSAHADGSIYSGVETASPVHAGNVFPTGVPAIPIIRFAEDRTALAIAANYPMTGDSGGTAYISSVLGILDANLATTINFDPSSVCILDNYTVWAAASNAYANQSDKMYSSKPLQPAIVPANSWATAEARADMLYDVVTLSRTFWAFGTRSVEMWYNPGGNIDFAFSPFTNSLLEVGLAARRTLANLHGKVMWVATDRRVWLGAGQSAQAVSPTWVDLLLQQLNLTLLTAYMYAQGGDEFYVLTYEGYWSIELALSTMTWVYRRSYGRLDHAGRCALEHNNGFCYVGLDTGEICVLNLDTPDEPNGRLTRSVTTMWVGLQEAQHTVDKIDVTSYMGPDAGDFSLKWSEDRGATWRGKRQITWPEPGKRRAIARALGSSRRRQFLLEYSGARVPFEVDEIFIQVSEGT